jgi:hypothetical protein
MNPSIVESWKAWAVGDAGRRGLHALKPILEGLAASTSRLRATSWQPAPDEAGASAAPPAPGGDAHGR